MTKLGPLREIVSRTYYRPTNLPKYANSSVIVTLSCGHIKRFKGSTEPNKKARCRECLHNEEADGPIHS